MTGAVAGGVAVAAGSATVLVVLVLGAVARGAPAARSVATRDDPSADGDDPHRRSAATRTLIAAAAVVAIGAAWLAAGPAGAAGLGLAAVVTRHRRRSGVDVRRRQAIDVAMPDAIELLVLCVHAGRSPTQAVTELARRAPPAVRAGFAAVERQLHRGRGLADALGELPVVLGAPARELAATVAVADREGLPLAPMLDRLAADARAARRRHGEAAARRLPVQLSFPLVACVLPAFVLLGLAPAVLGAVSTLRGTAP